LAAERKISRHQEGSEERNREWFNKRIMASSVRKNGAQTWREYTPSAGRLSRKHRKKKLTLCSESPNGQEKRGRWLEEKKNWAGRVHHPAGPFWGKCLGNRRDRALG